MERKGKEALAEPRKLHHLDFLFSVFCGKLVIVTFIPLEKRFLFATWRFELVPGDSLLMIRTVIIIIIKISKA